MATILTLNFVSEPIDNKFIAINAEISGVPTLPIGMDFVDQRLGKYESTAPSGEVLSVIASNFANAFNIDYSIYGSANANGNYVTITFINASAQVTSVSGTAIFDNNILYTAYSPLGSRDRAAGMKGADEPDMFEIPRIKSIAEKHDVHPAQILIKWAEARGSAVIPKSVNPARLKANLASANIPLSDLNVPSKFCSKTIFLPPFL